MSVWPHLSRPAAMLLSDEGELVLVRITIEPRVLESLLDVLAHLDFPINPEIWYAAGPETTVEFPAWSARVDQIRDAVLSGGFGPGKFEVVDMLEEIRAPRRTAASAHS